MRWRALVALLLAGLAGCRRQAIAEEVVPKRHATPWPLWQAYAAKFISPEGRVIDFHAGDITTSEGQSYALFFSLVANDRPTFNRVLKWTEDNLARGSLAENLPAWRWGKDAAGKWTVLDANSAADADLWIGYTLLQAGWLWRDKSLTILGHQFLQQVVKREVATLPGLGAMLLPGPVGFVLDGDTWRLNASYLPPQLLRGLEAESIEGPWGEIRKNAILMLRARGSRGFVDDWTAWHKSRGFIADPVSGTAGSYDAIRVYLWVGTLSDKDEAKAPLSKLLSGPYRHWKKHGEVPEKADVMLSEQVVGKPGPVGFLAVLWPRVHAGGNAAELAALQGAIEKARDGALYGKPPRYYDQNLVMFAQGFVAGRYHFGPDGRLRVPWKFAPPRAGADGGAPPTPATPAGRADGGALPRDR